MKIPAARGSGAACMNLTGFASNAVKDPESLRRSVPQSQRALASGRTSGGRRPGISFWS